MRLVLRLPRVTALFPSASSQAVGISVMLHIGLLVGVFVAANFEGSLPERPQVYTVALVQEATDRPAAGSPAPPQKIPPRQEPAPVPSREPEPPPQEKPKPVPPDPEPAPTPKPTPEDTPEERKIPPKTESPQPPQEGAPDPGPQVPDEGAPNGDPTVPEPPAGEAVGSGDETGLVAGPGSAGGVPTIDSAAFPFSYYRRLLTTRLRAAWSRPVVPGGLRKPIRTTVRFEILRGGAITGVETVTASGYAPLDRSALRAVYDANPLPPLPEEFDSNRLAVNFYFELTPGS